jgi:hypothetical protein
VPIQRHSLRWANGIGFALTVFYAAWLLIYALVLVQARFADAAPPMPLAFAVVGLVSLLATIGLLAVVLFGYALRGADLNETKPRYLLFGWTCAGCLFCLSQSLVLLRVGGAGFPHLPGWASAAYWYFCALGSAVFLVLLWVNAEGHHYPWEHEDEEDYDPEQD